MCNTVFTSNFDGLLFSKVGLIKNKLGFLYKGFIGAGRNRFQQGLGRKLTN